MAGRWIMNQQTGQPEWVEDGQSPQRWSVPPGTTQTPVEPLPPNLAFAPPDNTDRGQGSMGGNMRLFTPGFSLGLTGADGRSSRGTPNRTPATELPNNLTFPQPLDFSGLGQSPENQEYIRTLRAFESDGGPGEYPEAPRFEADPAAEHLAKRAAARDDQMQQLLDEMRADAKERDPARRTGLQRFGEFLSALAASGRLEEAGMIWNEIDARYRQEGRDLRNEMRQITMAGFESEDRRDAAQAQFLSAEHGARERTTMAGFQRDVGAYQAGESARQRQLSIRMALAEAVRNAGIQDRERQEQILGALIQDPNVSNQAADALAQSYGAEGPTAGLLSQSLVTRERAAGLMDRIMRANLGTPQGRTELAQYLRAWDPTITAQDLVDADPQQVFMRVVQGRNAAQAFREYPELGAVSQYQRMFASPE